MAKPLTALKRQQILQDALTALRKGDARAAFKSAVRVAKNNPFDSDALILMAEAASGAGGIREALRVLITSVRAGNRNEDVLICSGNLHAQSGDPAGAEKVFRTALETHPRSVGAGQNLGSILLQNGKPEEAIGIFQALLKQGAGWQTHLGLANAFMAVGDLAGAEKALNSVVSAQTNHIGALNSLGQVLMEQGRYEQAAMRLEKAFELQPDHAGVVLNLGRLRRRQDRMDEAVALVRNAIALKPDVAEAWAALSDMLERMNDLGGARDAVSQGLGRFPDHPDLNLQMARLDRRQGNIAAAVGRLESVQDAPGDARNAAARHQELGVLYDKQNDPAKAWEHFTRAKENFAILSRQRGLAAESFFDDVAVMQQFVTETDFAALAPLSFDDGRESPCFVVGFLRSGTTLLHQILDSHDDVCVIDEKPMAMAAVDVLEKTGGGFPSAIASADISVLGPARAAYYRTLFEQTGETDAGTRIIDKFPFNLMRAPLLWRLFPAARFVLAIRHPLDVCLSCYMQAFQPSAGTSPFLSMENTVRAYCALMDMWLTFAEKALVDVITIRYEDLIADQEGVTRRLYDGLSLSWTDRALRFHEHAQQAASVSNPSYHQVVQPLYSDAAARWRRYEDQLKPFYDRLSPLVTAFGYKPLYEAGSAPETDTR